MKTAIFDRKESAQFRQSFDRLAPQADRFSEALYTQLFALAPSVRALFDPSMDEQYYKLTRMLIVMVEAVDEPEDFERVCRESGERHRQYGAVPAHYPVLAEAFVAALRETIGTTPVEEALWVRVYSEAARLMIEGTA